MGRQRKPLEEKKIPLKLSIKKSYVDKLKERKVNISDLVNKFFEDYLKK